MFYNNLISYYQKRAEEYEKVYEKPERQSDLQKIKEYLSQQFVDDTILEIACGTGYWTVLLAQQAHSVLATDINQEVIDIAKTKSFPKSNVSFQKIDFNNLPSGHQYYDGLFGGFIWSHILKGNLPDFIQLLFDQVKTGGQIIFLDNRYVIGSSTPISRKDHEQNSYQTRMLESGETYEVLKNFPNEEEIQALLKDQKVKVEWIEFDYYWLINLYK